MGVKKTPAVHAWPPGPGNLCCGVGAAKQQPSPHDRVSSKPTAAKRLQNPSTGPGAGPRLPAPISRTPSAVPSLLLTRGWGGVPDRQPPWNLPALWAPTSKFLPAPAFQKTKAKKKKKPWHHGQVYLGLFVCLLARLNTRGRWTYPTQEKFDVDKLLVAARQCQHNFRDNESCFAGSAAAAAGGGRRTEQQMLFSPSSFKPPELGNYCSRATALTTGAGSGRALGGEAAGTGRREGSFQVTLLHPCTRQRLAGCVVTASILVPAPLGGRPGTNQLFSPPKLPLCFK